MQTPYGMQDIVLLMNSNYDNQIFFMEGFKLKKFGIVLFAILLIIIGICLVNFDTIQMVLGKGEITMKSFEENKELLANNDNFKDVVVEEIDGKQVLSGVSNDEMTQVKVVSDGQKIEKVETQMDGSSLTKENAKDVLTKNLEGILSAVMDKKKIRGVELYVVKEALQQLKNNPEKVVINKTFGDVHLEAIGDISTGQIQLILNTNK